MEWKYLMRGFNIIQCYLKRRYKQHQILPKPSEDHNNYYKRVLALTVLYEQDAPKLVHNSTSLKYGCRSSRSLRSSACWRKWPSIGPRRQGRDGSWPASKTNSLWRARAEGLLPPSSPPSCRCLWWLIHVIASDIWSGWSLYGLCNRMIDMFMWWLVMASLSSGFVFVKPIFPDKNENKKMQRCSETYTDYKIYQNKEILLCYIKHSKTV